MNDDEAKRLEEVGAYLGLGASSAVRYLITQAHRAIKSGSTEANL